MRKQRASADFERETALAGIVSINAHIHETAAGIRQGTIKAIEPLKFMEEGIGIYYAIAEMFNIYGVPFGDTETDLESAHTRPEVQTGIDSLLGPNTFNIATLWEDHQQILRFMARQFWHHMKAAPTKKCDLNYTGLNQTLGLVNIEIRSDAMYSLLDITPEEFLPSYQLAGMHIMYLHHLHLSKKNEELFSQPFVSTGPTASDAFSKAAALMNDACARTAKLTGLDEQVIRDYVTAKVGEDIARTIRVETTGGTLHARMLN